MSKQVTKVSEMLIKAKKLIEDEPKWTQGFYAKSKDGDFVDSNSTHAVCFCSVGALLRIRGRMPEAGQNLASIQRVAEMELYKAMDMNVATFNDDNSHAVVMEAWDKAINSAIEKGI